MTSGCRRAYPHGMSALRRLSGAARIELPVGEAAGPRWLDVKLFDQNLHRVALTDLPWLQPSKFGARAAAMLSVPFGLRSVGTSSRRHGRSASALVPRQNRRRESCNLAKNYATVFLAGIAPRGGASELHQKNARFPGEGEATRAAYTMFGGVLANLWGDSRGRFSRPRAQSQ